IIVQELLSETQKKLQSQKILVVGRSTNLYRNRYKILIIRLRLYIVVDKLLDLKRCLRGVVFKPIVCSQTSDFEQGSVASWILKEDRDLVLYLEVFKDINLKDYRCISKNHFENLHGVLGVLSPRMDDFHLDLLLGFERFDYIKFDDGESHCLRGIEVV
ncbi:predicted protein, partial [Arabidopsis lyrata subsp. lyrata]